MSGIRKFKPGVKILRYFPNTVITATLPCLTVTKHKKRTAPMRIKSGKKGIRKIFSKLLNLTLGNVFVDIW